MGILFILIVLGIFFVPKVLEYNKYSKSTYFNETGLALSEVKKDIGRLGEYDLYKYLTRFEDYGAKFLFNCYVPRGDEYTEVDVIMLYHSGVFVFESKNYSGWIFGDDKSQYWTQTLPSGSGSTKEKFFK